VEFEIIGMHGNRGVFELDDQFNAFAFGAGGEVQQRMLVEAELGQDSVEARGGGFGHSGIVNAVSIGECEGRMPLRQAQGRLSRQPAGRRRYSALFVAQRFDGI
jgi:hypothetical protein